MPLFITDILQGSPEWINLKLGKPSASNASKIITNDGLPSKQRTGYLHELVSEVITGRKEESYKNANMLMGNEREEESRLYFALTHNVEVEQIGVIYKDENKEILCSPDGVIDRKYGLELKNVLPKTQVKYLLDNKLPSEYFSQVQFSLYVTGFEYWWFMSYVPNMRPLIIRVLPDLDFHKKLELELIKFNKDLNEIVKKIGG